MNARLLAAFSIGLLLSAGATAESSRGRTNYLLHCSGCHQQDGSGSVTNGIPNMKGVVGNFLRTAEGRNFLVQVPGTSQAALDDAAIAELLNWMVVAMSRNEVPTDFKPYSREEVARLRADHLADVPGFRAKVVGQLQQLGYRVE